MKKVSIGVMVVICVLLSGILMCFAKMTARYTPLGVPHINSSFKTYMDYRAVTNKQSAQYKFIQRWGWCDSQKFMRCGGE